MVSISDELEKLASLMERGLLTREEFDRDITPGEQTANAQES